MASKGWLQGFILDRAHYQGQHQEHSSYHQYRNQAAPHEAKYPPGHCQYTYAVCSSNQIEGWLCSPFHILSEAMQLRQKWIDLEDTQHEHCDQYTYDSQIRPYRGVPLVHGDWGTLNLQQLFQLYATFVNLRTIHVIFKFASNSNTVSAPKFSPNLFQIL